jgi:anti-sigma factor RsiW
MAGAMMDHASMAELLGAYALDALEPEERAAVEAHLASCPRCEAEVAELQQAASMLGNDAAEAPSALWDRVAERLDEVAPLTRGTTRPEFLERLGHAPGQGSRGLAGRIRPAAHGSRDRLRRLARGSVVVLGAAAAASIAFLGVDVAHLDQRIAALGSAPLSTRLDQVASEALMSPSSERVVLASPTAAEKAEVVLVPRKGLGFVVRSRLAPLPPSETYQLWGEFGTRRISLGVLGNDPSELAFAYGHNLAPKLLEITVEPAGGVVVPTQAAIVWGSVPTSTL